MFINQIILKNFQKHDDLKLDFKDSINIIHGPSGAGKSCIRRSIEWCLFCANISNVRKLNTKKTSVKVIFDNGYSVERIKSASINRYIFNDGNSEDLIWDKFGSDMPDELKEKLNVQTLDIEDQKINLNISNQIDSPFLIGKEYSGSFKLKLFNKLTGVDEIDGCIKNVNKKLKEFKNLNKYAEEQLEQQNNDLEEKNKEYSKKFKLYNQLKIKFNKLNKLSENINQVQKLIDNIKKYEKHQEILESEKSFDITIDIKQLKEKIDTYIEVKKLHNSILKKERINDALRSKLKEIVECQLDLGILEDKIKDYTNLYSIITNIQSLKSNIDKLEQKKSDIEFMDKNNEIVMNNILKNVDVCEECGQIKGTGKIL